MPVAAARLNTQMNVRIDRQLKERGDAALCSAGFSPTEAVRALWQLACGTARDLDDLTALLQRGRSLDQSATPVPSDEPLRAGWSLYADACARIGIPAATPAALTDEELLEQALLERLSERGLA